ncbi:hypothetical protein [Microbacterium sp. KRD172]|uniref:hypothetical protein n=1 Tax=Microbacterium sp. KRD172 TaxID=2729727 RepID=UPI0019D01FE4|nr:hypothetical protein [Microbacterium sp. KRD172]
MSALALPASWDRAALEGVGFSGFVTFAEIPDVDIPPRPGIYVVLRTAIASPEILDSTVARAGSVSGRLEDPEHADRRRLCSHSDHRLISNPDVFR